METVTLTQAELDQLCCLIYGSKSIAPGVEARWTATTCPPIEANIALFVYGHLVGHCNLTPSKPEHKIIFRPFIIGGLSGSVTFTLDEKKKEVTYKGTLTYGGHISKPVQGILFQW
jgi:hypothetical protein